MSNRWFLPMILGALIASLLIGVGFYLGKAKTMSVEPKVRQVEKQAEKPVVTQVERFDVGPRNVKAMLADGSVIWVGTSGGIVKYDTKSKSHETFSNSNSDLVSNGIFSLDKIDGRLWVGTYGGGLSIFDGKEWKNYNIPEGLADGFVYGVLKAANGDIWIATWSGANQIVGGDIDNPAAWRTYTVENTNGGLPNDWVYGLGTDPQGNIWIGTEGGLSRYDGSTWKNWHHEDGLGASYETVKNHLLESLDPATRSKHHAKQKVEMGLEGIDVPYNPNYIVSMMVDSEGRVWCGTWGGGLSILENGKFKTFTTEDGLPGNYISMLKKGPDGTIWVGSNQGLSRMESDSSGTRFRNYNTRDGLYGNYVFSMAFGEDGSPWVGSYGGAVHFVKWLQ